MCVCVGVGLAAQFAAVVVAATAAAAAAWQVLAICGLCRMPRARGTKVHCSKICIAWQRQARAEAGQGRAGQVGPLHVQIIAQNAAALH